MPLARLCLVVCILCAIPADAATILLGNTQDFSLLAGNNSSDTYSPSITINGDIGASGDLSLSGLPVVFEGTPNQADAGAAITDLGIIDSGITGAASDGIASTEPKRFLTPGVFDPTGTATPLTAVSF